MEKIKFTAGAHSTAEFVEEFLTPLFEARIIPEFPGADNYAICYGELCAYLGDELLATWSREVPDRQPATPKLFIELIEEHKGGSWQL
jgi:hypothetical protein